MENNYFYKKFQTKSDSELERILNSPKAFEGDAIIAATQILKERNVGLTKEQSEVAEKIEEKRVQVQTKKAEVKKSQNSPLSQNVFVLY